MNWDEVLERDARAMRGRYPQFTLCVLPEYGDTSRPPQRRFWRGWIQPFRSRVEVFELVLEYRATLEGVAKTWIVWPEVSRRTYFFHPHLHPDGSACTFFVSEGTYDPGRDPIHVLAHLASDWLRCHVYRQERGHWPGPEAPHDPVGVLEITSAKAPCVCGSGKRFHDCCWKDYSAAAKRQRAGQPWLPAQRLSPAERQALVEELSYRRSRMGPVALAELFPRLGPPATYLRRPSHSVLLVGQTG